MNIEQEYLRITVNSIIKEKGIKASFICQLTGIDTACFSRFRSGHRYLSEHELSKLKDYVNNKYNSFH